MRPTPGKYQHKGDMDAALGTYQRKGFVPFKSMNTSAKSSPDNVISNNKLSIHGDRPVSPPGAPSALLSRFIKTVKTVTIANQMMRQSVPVHSISLGAESLAMAHGQWDLPKGRPPDALEETKAESIGQALRKVRKGYDIEGAGDGVGMGVVGSKKANPKKHHGGKDLSGGFFQSSKKEKDNSLELHKKFAKQVRLRVNKSGIKAKDVKFTAADYENFKKRKFVVLKAFEHFKLDQPHTDDVTLTCFKALGHPLNMDEVHEAFQACNSAPPTLKQIMAGGDIPEWKPLKETAVEEGLSEDDFIRLVCHFEVCCGVKLLQPRLVSSSWLQPRVAGKDATKYVTDEGLSFSGFSLKVGDDDD
jgi:hypothetical protein